MGQIIKAVVDGEEREFEIQSQFGHEKIATHAVNKWGEVVPIDSIGIGSIMIGLTLVRKQHTFGRVVFEETGEVRSVKHGEWRLIPNWGAYFNCSGHPTKDSYPILRPVDIEEPS